MIAIDVFTNWGIHEGLKDVVFPALGVHHGGLANLFLQKIETEAAAQHQGFLYRTKDWGTDRDIRQQGLREATA